MLPEPTEDIARWLLRLEKRIERLERLDEVFTINSGEVVINEAGLDTDYRVESNTDANMLFVDGGSNRVGIGTASPDRQLDIERSSAGDVGVQINNSSASAYSWIASGAAGAFANASIGLRNDSNGRRPIEFANDGGVFCYHLLAAAASSDVNINGSNELHSVPSAKRFKKYVGNLDRRFNSSLIYDLVPRSFVWRKDTDNPDMVDFGLVAEEVYEVFPELVNLDQDEKPYSVRHSLLPVLLLAELQKLERRVGTLEAN